MSERLRIALLGLIVWAARHRPLGPWLSGPSYWDARWQRLTEATVCRLFGHRWHWVSEPSRGSGAAICEACTFWPADVEDLPYEDWLGLRRHVRDFLEFAYQDHVEALVREVGRLERSRRRWWREANRMMTNE